MCQPAPSLVNESYGRIRAHQDLTIVYDCTRTARLEPVLSQQSSGSDGGQHRVQGAPRMPELVSHDEGYVSAVDSLGADSAVGGVPGGSPQLMALQARTPCVQTALSLSGDFHRPLQWALLRVRRLQSVAAFNKAARTPTESRSSATCGG